MVNSSESSPEGSQQHREPQPWSQRPIFAGGNSDGDHEMLEWTTAGSGPRFGLIVHHTDGIREAAYDRDSSVGRLDTALDQANDRGWTVVDMKHDWKVIYAPANQPAASHSSR